MMSNKLSNKPVALAGHSPWRAARAGAIGLAVMAACTAWAAPTVLFTATDLADATPGQDLWRYDYSISGPVDAFGSVNLLFSPSNYADLVSQTVDANLSLLDAQPDAGAPADGIVFVTALNGLLAADTAAFSVDFTWLGGAGSTPGAQAFEVVDANGFPAGSGVSRAANGGGTVPEPSALGLSLAALLALAARRKRAPQA